MDKCKSCNHKSSKLKILRKFLLGYNGFSCENCGTKYEEPTYNRFLKALSIGLGLLLAKLIESELIANGYGIHFSIFIAIYIALVSIMMVLIFSFTKNKLRELKHTT
jgi:CXXC-20-CXXC protein